MKLGGYVPPSQRPAIWPSWLIQSNPVHAPPSYAITSILILSSHLSLSSNLSHSLRFPHQNSARTSTPSERAIRDNNLIIFRRVHKIAKATVSFFTSVRPSARNKSAHTGRIFMKFQIWRLPENLSIKIQVSLKSDKNNVYFKWTPCTFVIESRLILLRIRNFFDKSCRKKQNTFYVP
jgi:hypothetical protein